MKVRATKDLACRTGVSFLHFSGERGQARGKREVRDTRDRRGTNNGWRTGVIFFAPLPSRVSRTSRSPRAYPRSPEKRKKNNACSAGYQR